MLKGHSSGIMKPDTRLMSIFMLNLSLDGYLDRDGCLGNYLSEASCCDEWSTDLYLVYPSRPPSSYDYNKNWLCSSKLTFKSKISPTKGKWTWQSCSALCSQSWATRKPGRWTLMILSSTCLRLKRCDCYEFWEIGDFPFKFTHKICLL